MEDSQTRLSTPAPGAAAADAGQSGEVSGDRVRRAGRLRSPRRSRFAAPRTLAVVFGGISAMLLVLVIVFALLWDGARGEQGDTDAVRRVAGAFTDRFLTLDSKDLEPNKRGVLALSTGAFKRTYEEGLETQVLQAILALGDTTTEATITEIYLGDVDARTAHVIVQAETTAYTIDEDGTARPPLTQEIYIELDLLKQDGAWLVDHVAHLNFGGPRSASDTPSEPAPSPTTGPA